MARTGWLAALILALAPWPSPAQFGGMGGGIGPGMGPGMGGMMGRGGNQLWNIAASSQKTPETWEVKVETYGNQIVTGKLSLTRVFFQSEVGIYEIPPEKVKSIEFSPPAQEGPMVHFPTGAQRNGSVITKADAKLTGTVLVPNTWKIETDLGTLTPDAQQLKTLTFVARSETAPAPAHAQPALGKPAENAPAPAPAGKPGEGGTKPGEVEKKP